QDAVDAHLCACRLDGETLGEADDAPFRRRGGAARREAVPGGSGGQVDDRAAARALYERHRLSRAVEHAVQVHRDAALPVFGTDVLDLGGGTGDAGVIHQHVQAPELALDI